MEILPSGDLNPPFPSSVSGGPRPWTEVLWERGSPIPGERGPWANLCAPRRWFTSADRLRPCRAPGKPEALRKRFTVLENASLYAQLKHSANSWLSDLRRGDLNDLSQYLLGEEVMELEAAKETNTHIPWGVILKYEFQPRKKATE